MKTLNVIGCGRVGQTLAHLLQTHRLCQVQDLKGQRLSATEQAAQFIGAGRVVERLADMRPADLWLITVPDTQIEGVANELADLVAGFPRVGPASPHPIAFHCSGFLSGFVLSPLARHGFQVASVHPVLNFANPGAAVAQFAGTPCGLEGDAQALQVLQPLLSAIGGECFAVDTASKSLYHAAAVFCSNFTMVLQAIAQEAWRTAGVPDDQAAKIQAALLQTTVKNFLAEGPRALTGPAARGDTGVVRAQGADVAQWNPDAGLVYQELSLLARRLALTLSVKP